VSSIRTLNYVRPWPITRPWRVINCRKKVQEQPTARSSKKSQVQRYADFACPSLQQARRLLCSTNLPRILRVCTWFSRKSKTRGSRSGEGVSVVRQSLSVPFCALVLQFIGTDISCSTGTVVSSPGKYYRESIEGLGLLYWQKDETLYRSQLYPVEHGTVLYAPKSQVLEKTKAIGADWRFISFRL